MTFSKRARSFFAVALIAGLAASASAQLIAYDGFGNGPLANLHGSAGGTGWAGPWAQAADQPTGITQVGLSWPGMATTPGAAITPIFGGPLPPYPSLYHRALPPLPSDTTAIYVSFLLRCDEQWGTWGGLSFGTSPWVMQVGKPLGIPVYGLQLGDGPAASSLKPVEMHEPTLVVVRISRNTPAPGISYRMYLDPAVGSAEPATPDAMLSVEQIEELPTVVSIDNDMGWTTDEIRVGTTWDSMLPPDVTWADLGFAKTSALYWGTPVMKASGTLEAGATTQINLSSFAPSGLIFVVYGLDTIYAPFKGGTMVPLPQQMVPVLAATSGKVDLTFKMPAGVPADTVFYFHAWIHDWWSSWAASNAMQAVTP